jgi:hypothetical protein
MKIRSMLLVIFLAALAGCSSEEPGPMRFPEEPIHRDRQAPELVPPSADVTATERWHAKLEKIAPAGWTVGDAVDQLEAPEGWSRVEGGRGIAFTIAKCETPTRRKAFTLWFMPLDWKGKFDGPTQVKCFGASKDWQLYYTVSGHEGWDRPAEDVARAFKVAARG